MESHLFCSQFLLTCNALTSCYSIHTSKYEYNIHLDCMMLLDCQINTKELNTYHIKILQKYFIKWYYHYDCPTCIVNRLDKIICNWKLQWLTHTLCMNMINLSSCLSTHFNGLKFNPVLLYKSITTLY